MPAGFGSRARTIVTTHIAVVLILQDNDLLADSVKSGL
jgi:hypothetical protein